VLLVTSERRKTYQVDLKTKTVTQSDPSSSPSPVAIRDIPEAIRRAIVSGSLAKDYDVSQIKLFCLRGDFNGDGKADIAVLVKQRSTGKLGIAIVNGATDKVVILGAGNAIAMVVMTSSGWIPGRFIPKAAPPRKLKEVSHISAVTRFSWVRARQPAR